MRSEVLKPVCAVHHSRRQHQVGGDLNPAVIYDSWFNSLEACRRTLDELATVLLKVQGGKSAKNLVRKAIQQIRLDWNSGKIFTYRAQIQVHTAAMQMLLQSINM